MAETAPAASPREGAEQRMQQFEDRIDRLALACAALWSLLKEQTPLKDDDILLRITDLDLADDRLDGRIAPVLECRACGRKSARRHPRCLWCGRVRPPDAPFEGI
jgi:hypothetical protein